MEKLRNQIKKKRNDVNLIMSLSKKEEKIYNSIKIASENDPKNPEFPPNCPRFPATPTYKINVPGFSNVWLKDESYNPTGTHKDRMAWEMVVNYKQMILSKKERKSNIKLPQLSIISSGSAAIAIQSILKIYTLPSLKVLVDKNTKKEIIKNLQTIGCKIYFTDLSKKELTTKEILSLTKNKQGFDITSNEAVDPTTRFYDWLSYEIINNHPDYCFIPFGTGNLYENILNINKKEITTNHHDPRFKGNKNTLKKCNFIGATSRNRNTLAEKLYSPHLPFVHYNEQWIKFYRIAGYCGSNSAVYSINEKYLIQAINLAKKQGINAEPSGLAGLAMLLQLKNKIPKNKKILIVNTGKTKYPIPF